MLVIGGSLGSKTINESMAQNLNLFKKHKLNLIWQTGISFDRNRKILLMSLGRMVLVLMFL